MRSAVRIFGSVFPHPVGTELRMWPGSSDHAAAVTSACDEYKWMTVSRFPAVPGNDGFLGAMQGAPPKAECRYPWSQLSFAISRDRHHLLRYPSLPMQSSPFLIFNIDSVQKYCSYVSQEIWMVNNTSKTDVAPWCYKWVMGWLDWIGYLRVG